jgi:dihydroflavonol-4-reductase
MPNDKAGDRAARPVLPPALVALTGASGFLARHVARRLLEDGYRVRATLRTLSREGEVRAAVLPGLAPDAGERLSFARADLGADEGWAEALDGCEALIHTASPFPLARPRDRDALVGPAVGGTRRALEAAALAGASRVVLTSSVVAIRHEGPPAVQDEADWADPEAITTTPYARSKTLAERAAWDLARERGLQLTVINPGFILGPILGGAAGTSAELVGRLLKGRDPMLPNLDVMAVDARDVAAAHVLALSRPATAGERIAAVAGDLSFPGMARILKATYPERRIPTRVAPDWLIRALSLAMRDLRAAVPLLGVPQAVSNAKALALLGIEFIPPEEALKATARDLIARGLA